MTEPKITRGHLDLARAIVDKGHHRTKVAGNLGMKASGLSLLLAGKRGAGRVTAEAARRKYAVTVDAWSALATEADRDALVELVSTIPSATR